MAIAAIATGLAAHKSIVEVVAAFGKSFVDSRSVAIVWLALPVIGMLERYGLKEQARSLVSRLTIATTGRLLLAYLAVRQLSAALGLTSLGGHAQMVRPLIAPMSEAAAENRFGGISKRMRYRIRAHAAATDNIGVFFGEDIFIAIGSILLIRELPRPERNSRRSDEPRRVGGPDGRLRIRRSRRRLLLLDRSLGRDAGREANEERPVEGAPSPDVA